MAHLHVKCPKELVQSFSGLSKAVCIPGRYLMFQEPVLGGKIRYEEGNPYPIVDRRRAYHLVLMNDAVIVGKHMGKLAASPYRGHSYPLRKCELWIPPDAKALAPSDPHVLRLRCSGALTRVVDPLSYVASNFRDKKNWPSQRVLSPTALQPSNRDRVCDFLLVCDSAEQLTRIRESFEFLKKRVSPHPVPGLVPEPLYRFPMTAPSGFAEHETDVDAPLLSTVTSPSRVMSPSRTFFGGGWPRPEPAFRI